MINQVYPDSRGFLWIATESGLNKYDGSKFITYKHNRTDSTTLLDNYVRCIFEDSRGTLYVGGLKGIQRYNYEAESFTDIPIMTPDGHSVGRHIVSINELDDHSLLMCTSGYGILFLYPGQDSIFIENDKYNLPPIINASLQTSDKSIWLATGSDGVMRITPQGKVVNYPLKAGHKSTSTTCLCMDAEENIYAGTNGDGLFVLDKSREHFSSVADPSVADKPIMALYMNTPTELYIGTDGYGLRIYDTQKMEFKPIPLVSSVIDLKHSKIHSIAKDNYGNIWLGIYQKGVLLLPHIKTNFTY